MNLDFKKICIYGLGMMGGTIAYAIQKHFPKTKITAIVWNYEEKQTVLKAQVSNEIFTEEEFLKNRNWNEFEIVFLCLPVSQIIEKLQEIPDSYAGIVTEIGSTKRSILTAAEKKSFAFVGSHPICGSEYSGVSHAKKELFENRLCTLTKTTRKQTEKTYFIIETFWKKVGMKTIFMNAEEHDKVFCYISHFPHLLASLMVNWIGKQDFVETYREKSHVSISGGGLKDMIRTAGSNPKMWESIFQDNYENILKSLIEFKQEMEQTIEFFQKGKIDWISYIEKAEINKGKILNNAKENKNS